MNWEWIVDVLRYLNIWGLFLIAAVFGTANLVLVQMMPEEERRHRKWGVAHIRRMRGIGCIFFAVCGSLSVYGEYAPILLSAEVVEQVGYIAVFIAVVGAFGAFVINPLVHHFGSKIAPGIRWKR